MRTISAALVATLLVSTAIEAQSVPYPVIDTNQRLFYGNAGQIDSPAEGEAFYGQDAQYTGIAPSYTDNGNGTITDNNTGLMWAQDQSGYTMGWSEASSFCESLTTGGYDDWRLPTVKELWSLRDFSTGWPWLDTGYFHLTGDGELMSEHHSWSCERYLVESEYQNEQVEGDPAWIVNDWTGHIKAMSGRRFVRAVRGDAYGANDFVDNGDGTVTDNATGLMWAQDDSGEALYWEGALAYAESATVAGYDDWRLPNIKELQSLADYSVTAIPAMDASVFNLTEVTNTVYDPVTGAAIATQLNYPFYWSSTSNPIEGEGDDFDGGTIYAWFYSPGYNVDMGGYDLHGAGSVCFGAKSEANAGIEDSVPFMVRLVRGSSTVSDATTPVSGDYNGDGLDDLAVYERAAGSWYIRSLGNTSAPPICVEEGWGSASCDPVSGDYNGDGVFDLAAYERATGNWYIRSLGDSSAAPICFGQSWGSAYCDPVAGDYNGDGVDDLAVYERSTGNWYIRSLGNLNAPPICFGQSWGSIDCDPVAGDYNGDGVFDLAVYERTTGNWYIRSLGNLSAPPICFGQSWGNASCVPVSGDYNGDGVYDLAVYETTTGNWYIRSLGNTSATPICFGQNWGGSGLDPVSGDFNGDGVFDLAAYERDTGDWYIRSLGNMNVAPLCFGQNWGW